MQKYEENIKEKGKNKLLIVIRSLTLKILEAATKAMNSRPAMKAKAMA